jgi:hypothetical protein
MKDSMARSLVRFAHLMKTFRRRGRFYAKTEDLVREAFLRIHECCRNTDVRDEQAFLARTVSNPAINEYHRDDGLVLKQAQDEARPQDANRVRVEQLFEQTGEIDDELLRLQKVSVISLSDFLTAGCHFFARNMSLAMDTSSAALSTISLEKHNHTSEQRIAGGMNVCPA